MNEAIDFDEIISSAQYLDKDKLFDEETYFALSEMDDIEIQKYKIALKERARQLNCVSDFNGMFKAYFDRLGELKRDARVFDGSLPLSRDGNGIPLLTIDNFMTVINRDEKFKSLRFNELSYTPEHIENGELIRWTDADDAAARNHIEKEYALYHNQKYDDAMRIKFKQESYHPIRDIIEVAEWDGVERIATFLHKWMKCEDTPYTREVSRLIFAGGINRLYNPGCKFDDMPVLIGTRQGEGKSTFVRWLAIKDDFFREVGEIDGQKGIEAIEGGWICEMSELLALTKAKEVEAVKSYITKLVDTYRRPFDRRVTEHKRQCIFIGTTNKEQFLTDKTGNRRYYPVKVNQSGYDLFDHAAEIKADILQCWAEAKAKLDKGQMPAYADKKLKNEIKAAQQSAVEEDYREELIRDYLSDKDEICIMEIWLRALDNPDYSKPTKKDSNEIVLMIQSTDEWARAENSKRIPPYGKVRYWSRVEPTKDSSTLDDGKMLVVDNPFLI